MCIYIYIIYREVLKRVAVTSLSHPRQVRLHKNKKGGKIEVIASFACDKKNNRKKTQRADAAALTRPVRPKLTPPPQSVTWSLPLVQYMHCAFIKDIATAA